MGAPSLCQFSAHPTCPRPSTNPQAARRPLPPWVQYWGTPAFTRMKTHLGTGRPATTLLPPACLPACLPAGLPAACPPRWGAGWAGARQLHVQPLPPAPPPPFSNLLVGLDHDVCAAVYMAPEIISNRQVGRGALTHKRVGRVLLGWGRGGGCMPVARARFPAALCGFLMSLFAEDNTYPLRTLGTLRISLTI